MSSIPERTAGHGAAVLDGRIHVFGGEGTPPAAFFLHYSYDPAADEWSLRPRLPTGRHGLAVATLGGRIYTIGGGPQRGFSQSAVVEVFEPQ